MEVLKFPKLGLPRLWRIITLFADLRLKWGLKQSCSPCRELFNGIWHTTFTQGNWGDYWLLMVGSQINNLTPNPYFGHNLCFNYPIGSCEPILDIYVPRDFQCYKWLFNPMGFDLVIVLWKFRSPLDSNSQSGSSLGSVEVHSLTFSLIPSNMKCDSQALLLARTFVSLCFVHKPKARVATLRVGRNH
jgi:hypothetical protein